METIAFNRSELKQLIRETFVDVLSTRKDLIGDAVLEAIEDLGIGKAMEEGQTGAYVDTEEFKNKLHRRIKQSR